MSLSYSHANEIITSANKHVLWVGDIQAAENIAWLKEKNIKTGKLFTNCSYHCGFRL